MRSVALGFCWVLIVAWNIGFLVGARAEETVASPALSASLATSGPKPLPVEAPSAEAVERAIRRGVDFLLLRQNRDGSWGSAQNTKGLNIYAPVPGAHQAFRAAVTALCVSALIDVNDPRSEVREAIDRGEAWLLENLPRVKRATADTIYNNWAHAYALQALTRLIQRHKGEPQRQAELRTVMEGQLDRLLRYECLAGGWAYYDFDYGTQKPGGSTISFITATVLVALHEAKQVGLESPEKVIDRAKASILRQRKPDFSYCYGEYLKMVPMHPVNRPAGSLGRSQACNLAMRLWGDETVTDEIVRTWLDRFFARDGWLDLGRKRPIPHESFFAIAGYFFYYGHYYASLSIELLPEKERATYFNYLAATLIPLQEKDGSWWDFPFYDYHQQYGTAFALLALQKCREGAAKSKGAKGSADLALQ
ncbi:MAG: prenyltransferase/squalene oxidase repeat-containing protein [Thermogutta sp.]